MKTKFIFLAFLLLASQTVTVQATAPSAIVSSSDFLFFKANRFGRDVVVNWAYRNPLLVVFYYVERSTDGVNFTQVTDVMAFGEPWYRFRDRTAPSRGLIYYRITAFQHDGSIVYSQVESIRNHGNGCR